MQPPNQRFLLSAKINGTQREGTDKSTKNVLYVLRYAKRHLLGQSNIKQ